MRRGTTWLESAALARLPWALHAFSTRAGGVSRSPVAGLNLGYGAGDTAAHIRENRRRFFRALGAEVCALAEVRQIHSTIAYRVAPGHAAPVEFLPSGARLPGERPSTVPRGDALFTDQAGLLVAVRTADCLPVLLADTRRRAVGAIHAGWRGALGGVVEKAVGEMRRLFGSRSRDLLAALGPSIRVCCYEVGPEVKEAFCGRYPEGESFFRRVPKPPASTGRPMDLRWDRTPGHDAVETACHLDLVAVALAQLRRAGVPASHIQAAEFCTACRSDLFYSHRKQAGRAGRMMALIGIRTPSANS
jgi:purine-nucleoside/S-methyl-5'-thioadenosine phosphorylase / adenosine deaminase